MIVAISRALLEQIFAHAASVPQEEVCGLLFGDSGAIADARPAANVAPDRRRHFELDPAPLLAAHRAERAGGPKLVGHYHSHPGGMAEPSAQDAADANPGLYWLIVAGVEVGLFESVESGPIHGRFRRLAITGLHNAAPDATKAGRAIAGNPE